MEYQVIKQLEWTSVPSSNGSFHELFHCTFDRSNWNSEIELPLLSCLDDIFDQNYPDQILEYADAALEYASSLFCTNRSFVTGWWDCSLTMGKVASKEDLKAFLKSFSEAQGSLYSKYAELVPLISFIPSGALEVTTSTPYTIKRVVHSFPSVFDSYLTNEIKKANYNLDSFPESLVAITLVTTTKNSARRND